MLWTWSWGEAHWSILNYAALLFFGDSRDWRNVEQTVAYMEPGDDDCWYPAKLPRILPRYWQLNLPKARRPVVYAYCCPKGESA